MALYGITPEEVREVLESPTEEETVGTRRTALRWFPGRFSGYPLKVVYEMSGDAPFIVTAYPLKKPKQR